MRPPSLNTQISQFEANTILVLIHEHILNNINIILEIHIYIDYSKSYNLSHKKEIDMLREELDKRRDSTYKSHFKSTIQKN